MAQENFRPAVPNINPFTGKRFTSDEEREQFRVEHEAKINQMRQLAEQKRDSVIVSRDKIVAHFEKQGITQEDLRNVFGPIFR